MLTRDQFYIKSQACSAFDYDTLIEAREQLFRYSEPHVQYKYSYGKKKSDKEKKAHALDGIYTKLVDLGNNELMPQIVAPAEELHLLPAIGNSMNNHANEERFDRIDRNYQELKTMVQRALNGLPQLNAAVSGSDKI